MQRGSVSRLFLITSVVVLAIVIFLALTQDNEQEDFMQSVTLEEEPSAACDGKAKTFKTPVLFQDEEVELVVTIFNAEECE